MLGTDHVRRYFFNIHDGHAIPDLNGTELASLDDAKNEAVRLSGQLLSSNPAQFWTGEQWTLQVCDDTGLTLFTLNFLATMAPILKGY